jgi:putative aldouronate transport system substrate-binding protein
MKMKNVYPNVFMDTEDIAELSDLQADLVTAINTTKADWMMNGFTDADWDKYLKELEGYKLSEYLDIYQRNLDAFNKNS